MLSALSEVNAQVSRPGVRYSTRLLNLAPENTVLYVAIPNLSETPFDNATVNGKSAGLKSAEEIVLTSNSKQIGTPSAPDSGGDGFGACTWTTSCSVPPS